MTMQIIAIGGFVILLAFMFFLLANFWSRPDRRAKSKKWFADGFTWRLH